MSYNVSGLTNKLLFVDFFNYVQDFDLFFLYETHVTEDNISKFSNYFRNFKLVWKAAIKYNVKGRASGGSLFGIKISLLKNYSFEECEGVTVVKLLRENNMYIIPFYINCNHWNEDQEYLNNTMLHLAGKSILLIGDFNARIGNLQISTSQSIRNSIINSKLF